MLGNIYINKIHVRQCLCICLHCREGFSHPFNFFVVSKNPSHLISQQLGRNDFSIEKLPIHSYFLLCKQNNSISINQ